MAFPIGGQLEPTVYNWDIKHQMYWGHDLDLSGHVTSSLMWPLDSQGVVSYWQSIWSDHVSDTVVEIFSFKVIWVTTLTFWGHVTSSVTWTLDSQYGISYWWSIRTDRLSRTVIEILSIKCIGVTTLTFHVTWRHRSCDHWIPKVWFPIGSQYEPTMYLTPLLRY